jgi:hypothetical protein
VPFNKGQNGLFRPDVARTASDALAVDTDQTKGQVRGIRAAFVSELVKQMEANHPQDLLDLTVWLDQGTLLMSHVFYGCLVVR